MLGKRVEISAVCRDGSEILIELSLWASGDGDDWAAHGLMHDISDRKRLERRLEESARYFALPRPGLDRDLRRQVRASQWPLGVHAGMDPRRAAVASLRRARAPRRP